MEIWITNIGKKEVKISDLNLRVLPNQSLNITAIKKPKFTQDQIEQSAISGSISKNKNLIISLKRLEPIKLPSLTENKITFSRTQRSVIQVENSTFEELGSEIISSELKHLIDE